MAKDRLKTMKVLGFLDSITGHVSVYETILKLSSSYVIWWSCSQQLHLLRMWPWFNSLWKLFVKDFYAVFCVFVQTCKLLVRIKTLRNRSVCAQVNMVDHNDSCKHSKVTVHRQSWTMEIKKLCGGKNPTAINRLDHTIQCVGCKYISIPAFLFLSGLGKCGAKSVWWYFYLF